MNKKYMEVEVHRADLAQALICFDTQDEGPYTVRVPLASIHDIPPAPEERVFKLEWVEAATKWPRSHWCVQLLWLGLLLLLVAVWMPHSWGQVQANTTVTAILVLFTGAGVFTWRNR